MTLLRQLAAKLGLKASAGNVSVLIESALGELGHEPQSLQVLSQDTECSTIIYLQDADGVFVTAEPPESEESDEVIVTWVKATGVLTVAKSLLRRWKPSNHSFEQQMMRKKPSRLSWIR